MILALEIILYTLCSCIAVLAIANVAILFVLITSNREDPIAIATIVTILEIVFMFLLIFLILLVCYGIYSGNSSIIKTSICVLLLFVILLLAEGILLLIVENVVAEDLKDMYVKSSKGDEEARQQVDKFQKRLRCCGYSSKEDREVQQGSFNLISSCCEPSAATCIKINAYSDTCSSKVIDLNFGNVKLLKASGGLSVVMGVIQIVVVILLICKLDSIQLLHI